MFELASCSVHGFFAFIDPIVKTLTSITTALVAIFALVLGVAYFVTGQTNSIKIESYKRYLDTINALKALLMEQTRILKRIFDPESNDDFEVQLQGNANIFQDVNAASQKAMFIPGMSSVRERYLLWYDERFVEADQILGEIFANRENLKKTIVRESTGKTISELEAIITSLDDILISQAPSPRVRLSAIRAVFFDSWKK